MRRERDERAGREDEATSTPIGISLVQIRTTFVLIKYEQNPKLYKVNIRFIIRKKSKYLSSDKGAIFET